MPMPAEESDPIPLDGKTPMTEAELLMWRKFVREYSHWSWVKRRVFPLVLAIGAGVWSLIEFVKWALAHIKVTP